MPLAHNRNLLIGKWRKFTTSKCAETYPDLIHFLERGTYRGQKGVAGADFTLWDAGSFEVQEEGQVTISTATDAEIRYRFRITGDSLTFEDPRGCVFEYRREP